MVYLSVVVDSAGRVGGLDPGLNSGGLVVIDRFDGDRVLQAFNLSEKKTDRSDALKQVQKAAERLNGWGGNEFAAAVIRSQWALERFKQAFEQIEQQGGLEALAIESFIDQPSKANTIQQKRWQTPLMTGYLVHWLETEKGMSIENGRIIYQDAGVVLPNFKNQLAELKKRRARDRDLIVRGDRVISNNHTRTALVHALGLSLRLKEASVSAD